MSLERTFDVYVRPRDRYEEENSFWTSIEASELWFDVIFCEKVQLIDPNRSLQSLRNERSFECFLNLEKHLQTKATSCPSLEKLAHRYSKHKELLNISPEVYIASQLQTFLEDLLDDKDVSHYTTLQHFFVEPSPYSVLIPSYKEKMQKELCEEELIDVKIPSGCTHEHQVKISTEEMASKKMVLVWKFASHGDPLSLCIRYGKDRETNREDSYYQFMNDDPYNSVQDDIVSDTRGIAMYRTVFEFFSNAAERLESFVYGHIVLEELMVEQEENRPTILTFEWDNRESTEVTSKNLSFSIKCIPLDQVKKVLEQDYIQLALSNSSTSLEEHLSTSQCLSESDALNVVVVPEVPINHTSNNQKVAELLKRVYDLEEELMCTKSELDQERQQSIQLKEKYDRCLKMIQQLQTTVEKEEQPVISVEAVISDEVESVESEESEESESENDPISDQDAWNSFSTSSSQEQTVSCSSSSVLLEEENERLKSLCATFQEQCIWRTIEAAESERRTFDLDSQLIHQQALNEALTQDIFKLKQHSEGLTTSNNKLKVEKKILIQEVKKLQKYSHVNVTALIQEAQEARMVQKHLQTKLNQLKLLQESVKEEEDTLIKLDENCPPKG